MTEASYNLYEDNSPLPEDITTEQAKWIMKERRKEANKKRSFANKYLKAYLKGKTQFQFGFTQEEGVKKPRIVNISSNEFDLHKKGRGRGHQPGTDRPLREVDNG